MKTPAIDVSLAGCAPVPLAHYLKALGILRLVSQQRDASAKGFWKNDIFHLVSALDRDGLVNFFLNDYHPTPIIAPWNGGSGFHPGDNKEAIDAIASSTSTRFDEYRMAIGVGRDCLDQLGLQRKPEKEEKQRLLQVCRNRLFAESLHAFDTAVLLAGDGAKFPPLVGTGWNDGRLEFTNNFMQRVIEVLEPAKGSATPSAGDWLKQSLFSDNKKTPPSKAPVGQFLPGGWRECNLRFRCQVVRQSVGLHFNDRRHALVLGCSSAQTRIGRAGATRLSVLRPPSRCGLRERGSRG
jgi:CRISPR-associated protein Csx17